jgi:hypothetical protein
MANAEGMATGMGGRASIDAEVRRGCLASPSTPSAVPSGFATGPAGGMNDAA